MKATILKVVISSMLVLGCDSDSDSGPASPPSSIAGSWFYCEFLNDQQCSFADDDGMEFSEAGEVVQIEEVSQGSLPECGSSPCFRFNEDQISVARIQSIGSFTYIDGELTLTIGGCSETARVTDSLIVSVFNVCEPPLDDASTSEVPVRIRLFSGKVDFAG